MSAKQRALDTSLRLADNRWKLRNRRKPRVLVYTDSRGTNMSTPRLAKIKHHVGSHVDLLQRDYWLDYVVCPFAHTTVIDFLNHRAAMDLQSYDAVILQCGVVDFSPRPLSNIARLKEAKAGDPRFDDLFAKNADYHANPSGSEYRGEPTTTLYSPEFQKDVIAELAQIPNLGWISSNGFVPGWDGNWKPRPSDIDEVLTSFDTRMHAGLAHTVDLREWSYDDVQRFTIDNIHFTPAGFEDVARRTSSLVQRVLAR